MSEVKKQLRYAPALEVRARDLERLAKTAPPITINPERMSGAPVIGLSRVPVATLLDYLATDHTLSDFLASFPGIERERAVAALDRIKEVLEEGGLGERVDY